MRSTFLRIRQLLHCFMVTRSSPLIDVDQEAASASTAPPPPAEEQVASSFTSVLEQNPVRTVPDEVQEQHRQQTPQMIINQPTTTATATSFNMNQGLYDHQHDMSNVNVQTVRLRVFHVTYRRPQLEHLGLDSPTTHYDQHIFIDIPSDLIQTVFQSYQKPPISVTLGKTFLGLTYQAVVAFLIFHFQDTPIFGKAAAAADNHSSNSHKLPAVLFSIAEVAVVMGFTACLIGILLRGAYRTASIIIEQAGSLAAAFGFFVMMGMFLTSISQWIGWLCGGASLVAFFLAFNKIKTT